MGETSNTFKRPEKCLRCGSKDVWFNSSLGWGCKECLDAIKQGLKSKL